LDYSNKNCVRAYYDQQDNLGFAFSNESNGITYSMFRKGWNIYVFNLTNSLENDPGFQLIKEGTTAIYVKFEKPVPARGITMVAFGEVDSLMLIDKNRSLTSDVSL
jgi:hypothetical protein